MLILVHNIFSFYKSESFESEYKEIGEADIEKLTMENTWLWLKEIKDKEDNTFSGNKNDDVYGHMEKEKVKKISEDNESPQPTLVIEAPKEPGTFVEKVKRPMLATAHARIDDCNYRAIVMLPQETDNPGTTLEEYIQFETERALKNGKVYNWETAKYAMINWSLDDVDINILRVSNLIAKNEHLKQTNKQLYDIRSKEQCDGLISQVNLKSVEISDLNASLQEKVLVITALKDELRKLKGKALVDNAVTKHTIDPEMLKNDVEPITPKLLNNMTAHSTYIKHTQEEAAVLRDLVEHVKANYPLDHPLESAYRYTKQIQHLLTNNSKTCPSINNSSKKLVVVTLKNENKRVRFTKPMLSSTGVKPSTRASGSQPSGNIKKDKIQQTPSNTQKNKVEAHPRKVKSSLKNKNSVVEPKGTATVQHSKLNANSELKYVKCNGCMLSDNHDLCVLDFINNVNARVKSKSVKKSSKRKVWKPTGKVFTNIGYIWRPTGRTFTIVGNVCPLTRITTTTEVPLRKPTALENETPKPVITLVYSRKPRKSKTNVPVSKSKVLKSVSANKKEPNKSWGSIVSDVPSSSLDECRYDGVLSYMSLVKGLIAPTSVSSELWSKDEALDLIIKFLKMIQVRLKVPVRRIRTDNGTEFVNQTLREYYEKVGISHETSVARSLQQNGVVERHNRTLIEAARTMLIYAKAPLFLWAEAVATTPKIVPSYVFFTLTAMDSKHSSSEPALHEVTPATIKAVAIACYTQNRSIIRLRHGKTPYELLHEKPPDLSFFHVFGALCYPTNDSEILGKLQPKVDIGSFVSTPEVIAPVAEVVAPEPAASTGSPSSTTVDQDAPSPKDNHYLDVAHMNNDPFFGILIPKNDSEAFSSLDIIPTIVHTATPNSEHVTKWTKDHPLENSILERHSTRRSLDRLVSWSSKRQKSAAISSTEAEYIALSGCCAQQVENEVVELYFVNTEYQLANIFTKALGRERIEFLINKLRMQSFTPETLKLLADEAEE
ncbi:retrovirus-related pol polyprotein from transposon TNT 1-94 [Tanacetum coccineum]|uniref:Retrovirus-related pol polyprotein from transposon TNT 1-94 n=1 Tax=Tanacetum coccineum TaxID=301880 RepID=A0ABQ4XHW6_9ASTR